MSMLGYLTSVTANDRNGGAKTVNNFVSLLFLVFFAMAIFLAIRDMGALHGTASKCWLFAFAVFAPELYVIIHGLSSASMGIPFFSETLVDVPMFNSMVSPEHDDSPVTMLASEIKHAAGGIKSMAGKVGKRAHDALDSATASISPASS